MKKSLGLYVALLLISAAAFVCTHADKVSLINYQGKLVQGTNLVTGNVSMTFRVYTNKNSGTYIYEETNLTQVIDGYYSVLLGSNPTLGDIEEIAREEDDTYLEVTINGAPLTLTMRPSGSIRSKVG